MQAQRHPIMITLQDPVPEQAAARPVIRFDHVTTIFAGTTVLNDISFDVRPGEFVCLLGPSGCGKSTTLRLIGDLLRPDRGTVEVSGRRAADSWRDLAYVFQNPRLLPWRTVLDNVCLGMELRGVGGSRAQRQARAREHLERAGLSADLEKYPVALSGGERQRVSIARALALDPEIILMDEPLSALDVKTKHALREAILGIWKRTAKTIVFVTHDIDEALYLADTIVVFSDKPTRVASRVNVTQQRPRNVDTNIELRGLKAEIRALFGNPLTDRDE
jgi:NitT/TauT family transport system ATP-binding protein